EKPWVKELKWVLEDLEDDPRKDVCRPSSSTNVKEIYITADNQESPKVKKRTKQKSEKSFPHSSRSRAVMTPVVPIALGELESPGTSDDEEATASKERVSSARERHEQARAMADTFTEKKSSTRLRSSCSQSANEDGSPLASTQSDKALRRDWLQHMITAGEASGDIIRTSSSASLSLPTIYEVVKGSSESKPDVSGDDVKKSKKSKCKVRQCFHNFTKALTGLLLSKDDHTGDGPIARSVTPSNDTLNMVTLNMVMVPPHPLSNWRL
ncbi:unnamed protein product, partial [Coregonus sp. 'balchen']